MPSPKALRKAVMWKRRLPSSTLTSAQTRLTNSLVDNFACAFGKDDENGRALARQCEVESRPSPTTASWEVVETVQRKWPSPYYYYFLARAVAP